MLNLDIETSMYSSSVLPQNSFRPSSFKSISIYFVENETKDAPNTRKWNNNWIKKKTQNKMKTVMVTCLRRRMTTSLSYVVSNQRRRNRSLIDSWWFCWRLAAPNHAKSLQFRLKRTFEIIFMDFFFVSSLLLLLLFVSHLPTSKNVFVVFFFNAISSVPTKNSEITIEK